MSDEHDILIEEDGTVRFVYSDELAPVFAGEEQATVRASHVEPYRGGWVADMEPSGGSWLFVEGEATRADDFERLTPFATRQAALDAERAWLREHKGL